MYGRLRMSLPTPQLSVFLHHYCCLSLLSHFPDTVLLHGTISFFQFSEEVDNNIEVSLTLDTFIFPVGLYEVQYSSTDNSEKSRCWARQQHF